MPLNLSSFTHCEQTTNDPTIVLQEKGRKAVFVNPRKLAVQKFRIDDCVITKGIRCDWLLLVSRPDRDIYVELKGCEILHAAEQLECTMKQVGSNRKGAERLCFIVASRVPKIGTDIQRCQSRFKRDYNSVLRVQNNVLKYVI